MSASQTAHTASPLVASLSYFKRDDLLLAGGKGANLGELSNTGFAVPPGFVITTAAYDLLLQTNGVQDRLHHLLASLAIEEPYSVAEISQQIGEIFQHVFMSKQITDEILKAYQELNDGAVAVRSSATAEDLPEASFAGQQETFLNVRGEAALLDAVRGCFASLYTDRAISYRENHGIDQIRVALSAGVQPMVRSDCGGAGVMFSVDTETGFPGVVVINAGYGLGETVVQGSVDP